MYLWYALPKNYLLNMRDCALPYGDFATSIENERLCVLCALYLYTVHEPETIKWTVVEPFGMNT